MTPRRFPPPCTIEEHNDACFIVRDKGGKALGCFYFKEEAGRREAAKGSAAPRAMAPLTPLGAANNSRDHARQ